jgi:hypothetical protein
MTYFHIRKKKESELNKLKLYLFIIHIGIFAIYICQKSSSKITRLNKLNINSFNRKQKCKLLL